MAEQDGMTVLTPKDWGPHYWFMFYTTAIAAPEKPSEAEQQAWIALTGAFEQLLPCSVCKGHYKEILKTHPPAKAAPGGRDAWLAWVLAAHNAVRQRQHKAPVTHQDVRHILGGMARRQQNYDRVFWAAAIGGGAAAILAAVLLYRVYYQKKN